MSKKLECYVERAGNNLGNVININLTARLPAQIKRRPRHVAIGEAREI